MMMLISAAALAAAQPAVQTPTAPSAHSEATAHQGGHCCCCEHGDQNREGCAEHAQHRGHGSHD